MKFFQYFQKRFERSRADAVIAKENRPKTGGNETTKKYNIDFQSNSTSTNFSLASDEDYDTDLSDDTNHFRDHSCIGIYKHDCRRDQVVPVRQYLENFEKDELSLNFYGLGPKGMRAFIQSLTVRKSEY